MEHGHFWGQISYVCVCIGGGGGGGEWWVGARVGDERGKGVRYNLDITKSSL